MNVVNVIILPEVLDYLENLVIILYDKGYFGFLETSTNYVQELLDNIQINLPTLSSKPAPKHFDKHGKNMEYAVFKKNKRTHWYVFFRVYRTNEKIIYQVRYIANNHTIVQYL
jgi:hypothetical protein